MFGTFAVYDYENKKTFTYTKMAEDGQTALVMLNFSDDEVMLSTVQRHLLGHEYRLLASNYAELREGLRPWEGRVYIIREGLRAELDGTGVVREVQDSMGSRCRCFPIE
jgi:alpha-glucosidase